MNTLVITEDGSHTLYNDQFGEHYHSTHGAIQESMHVFISSGLRQHTKKELRILEIGFGTGLNAFLSCIESIKGDLSIRYTAIELYPLRLEEVVEINYSNILGYSAEFKILHESPWENQIQITPSFNLHKKKVDLELVNLQESYDLIFFDAFSPEVQPELWTESVFKKLASTSSPGAILTTYSAKGVVRRTLEGVGYMVERIPGPPGKREILRATWPDK